MKKREVFSNQSMIIEKLPAYFLFAALAWVAWQLLTVVEPFLMVLIFSAIIATVTFPIYAKLETLLKGRKRLASVLTCLLVIFVIVIPILLFLLILVGQAVDLYNMVNTYVQSVDFNVLLTWKPGNFLFDMAGPYSTDIALLVQQNMDSLKNGVTQSAQFISKFAATQSAKILTDVGLSIFNLLLMFFTLFFLYKDGRHILKRMMLLSPIPVKYEKELFRKFNEISKATLFGTFLTAIAQGLVAWIGFSVAGVPSSFFWATAVSIFSLIPTVGTSIVWLPIGLVMLASGNLWGIFILIWGISLISTVDNVLRVIFIGSTANLNPLLTFISNS
jgi:predicted PurR-regulated permease PerM